MSEDAGLGIWSSWRSLDGLDSRSGRCLYGSRSRFRNGSGWRLLRQLFNLGQDGDYYVTAPAAAGHKAASLAAGSVILVGSRFFFCGRGGYIYCLALEAGNFVIPVGEFRLRTCTV